jgi:hypothetical protein
MKGRLVTEKREMELDNELARGRADQLGACICTALLTRQMLRLKLSPIFSLLSESFLIN